MNVADAEYHALQQSLDALRAALVGAERALRTIAYGTPTHWDREFAEGRAKEELESIGRVLAARPRGEGGVG